MKKIILLPIITGLCLSVAFGQVPESDSLALVALYNSTNGAGWTNNTNWLQPGQPVSTWFGITVTGNRVTEVELIRNNLTGTIPAEIGNLSYLSFLFLGNNQINGLIPPEIGNLENLTQLYLNENKLSDTIPVEIGKLNNLERLVLGDNELIGSIPDCIGNLNELKILNLGFNNLTGNIPGGIGNLVNLETLVLEENQLTGSLPHELGNLTNLKFLGLRSNELTGEIPAEIGNLTNLIQLFLGWNQLNGDIPVELFNLSNLKRLSLLGNQLAGSLPPEIGNLTNLEQLTIYDNQLSGSIPDEICLLSKITSLWIYNNQFTGPIPSGIGHLPELGSLKLANNYFTFSDLEALKGNSPEYFSYSPQLPVQTYTASINISTGANVELDITLLAVPEVEAENNTYQWWKDDDSLSAYLSSPVLTLLDVNTSDQGYYRCLMKNSDFPELTLYSDSIYLVFGGPTDIQLTADSIDENVPSGTLVGILSAENPDQSTGHSFTLVEGDGTNDADNDLFSIHGDSLIIDTSPDYESRQEYHIYIRVTDDDSKTFEKALVIYVNDLQESEPNAFTSKDIEKNTIKVYPNPADNLLLIQVNKTEMKDLQYVLYDMNGKALKQETLAGDIGVVNMANYPAGLYLLKLLKRDREIETFEIIKY